MGCAVLLMVVGCAGVRSEARRRMSKNAHLKQQRPKKPDAGELGPSTCRDARIPPMTCLADPQAACSLEPMDEISWTVSTAMTRYAASALWTPSSEG
jgi:hypothetical protein